MAIAEMQKLNVAALAYDRDKILNSLQWTGATEIKLHSEVEIGRASCRERVFITV